MRLFLLLGLLFSVFAEQCVTTIKCLDATCGIPFSQEKEEIESFCDCRKEDIGYYYTPCNNQTTSKIYFWKPPATCRSSSILLPSSVHGIPCDDIQCGVGKEYDAQKKTCAKCPPGSYNDGTGKTTFDHFHSWPAELVKYCAHLPDRHCDEWKISGDVWESGDNYNNHFLENYLSLSISLVKDGSVTFEFQVSAEQGGDAFEFADNQVLMLAGSNTPGNQWLSRTFPLSRGFHRLDWIYAKDSSRSAGLDKAQIRSIRLIGLTHDECQPCPEGTFADTEGAEQCQQCPGGSTATEDRTGCSQCTAQQYSLPSGLCANKRKCTPEDYATYETPCENNRREQISLWLTPHDYCDNSDVDLPRKKTLQCKVECREGQFEKNGKCEYCPSGQYSSSGTTCAVCNDGWAANSKKWIASFESFEQTFTTGCTSTTRSNNCFSNGWRNGHRFIDSGSGHGPNIKSWVQLDLEMETEGSVSYNLTMACDFARDSLLVTVDDQRVAFNHKCSGCAQTTRHPLTYTVPLTAGSHTIRWTFLKSSPVSTTCDRALIHGVEVIGSTLGGSTWCYNCPENTKASRQSGCQLCPAGQWSPKNSLECQLCPANHFSAPGGGCVSCGDNTFSAPGSAQCSYNCSEITLRELNRTWDLHQLKDVVEVNTVAGKFYFSFCSKTSMCEGLETHACVVNKTYKKDELVGITTKDVGSLVSFQPSNAGGLEVVFSRGEVGYRTSIIMTCSKGALSSVPELVNEENSLYTFRWHSEYACPRCKEDDYTSSDGPCVSGKRQRVFFLRDGTVCSGGYVPPSELSISCSEFTFSAVTMSLLIIVGSLSVLILFALAFMVLFFLRKSHDLEVKYQQLKQSSESATREVSSSESVNSTEQ